MNLIKRWIEQYKCRKTGHPEGKYIVNGHNYSELIRWIVFLSYPDTFQKVTGKIERIPKYWKVVIKCKYCGKKESHYYSN